jgi:hypothetical protein
MCLLTIFDAGDGHQAPGWRQYDYLTLAYYDRTADGMRKSFRDPHVFYYAPTDSYYQSPLRPPPGRFLRSKDLKHWEHLSDLVR